MPLGLAALWTWLVDIEPPVRLPPAVTVPLDALVDSGARLCVYVEQGEGIFEPRNVETGRRFDERVEILQGVQPEQSSPNLVVAFPHRLRDAADGNTIGLETIRVYVEIIMPHAASFTWRRGRLGRICRQVAA